MAETTSKIDRGPGQVAFDIGNRCGCSNSAQGLMRWARGHLQDGAAGGCDEGAGRQ